MEDPTNTIFFSPSNTSDHKFCGSTISWILKDANILQSLYQIVVNSTLMSDSFSLCGFFPIHWKGMVMILGSLLGVVTIYAVIATIYIIIKCRWVFFPWNCSKSIETDTVYITRYGWCTHHSCYILSYKSGNVHSPRFYIVLSVEDLDIFICVCNKSSWLKTPVIQGNQ